MYRTGQVGSLIDQQKKLELRANHGRDEKAMRIFCNIICKPIKKHLCGSSETSLFDSESPDRNNLPTSHQQTMI